MSVTTPPSDVIFTAVLILRRFNPRMLRVCRDIRGLIREYLYETVNDIDDYGDKRSVQVINGVRHGILRRWYKSGKLWRENMYKNGIKHGMSRGLYKSGKLEYEFMYKHGIKHGLSRVWWKSGDIHSECMYKNDIVQ